MNAIVCNSSATFNTETGRPAGYPGFAPGLTLSNPSIESFTVLPNMWGMCSSALGGYDYTPARSNFFASNVILAVHIESRPYTVTANWYTITDTTQSTQYRLYFLDTAGNKIGSADYLCCRQSRNFFNITVSSSSSSGNGWNLVNFTMDVTLYIYNFS